MLQQTCLFMRELIIFCAVQGDIDLFEDLVNLKLPIWFYYSKEDRLLNSEKPSLFQKVKDKVFSFLNNSLYLNNSYLKNLGRSEG